LRACDVDFFFLAEYQEATTVLNWPKAISSGEVIPEKKRRNVPALLRFTHQYQLPLDENP
jgi:hypothetical protein